MASPRIVYVTFGDDPLERSIVRFHERLRDGSYFNDAGREYGVGPLASVEHVRIPGPAPETIDDAGIHEWLAERMTDPRAPTTQAPGTLGRPDASTLYALYFPAQTTIHYANRRSCTWNGYHGDTRVQDTPIAYAVLPRCAADEPGTTELDRLTLVASHEYFEWVTDPFPRQIRAWHFVPGHSAAWALAFAAELADLCYGYRIVPEDLGVAVQPVWSNEAARAGHDPCQPAAEGPFAIPVPRLPDRFELPEVNAMEVLPPTDQVPVVLVAPGAEARVLIDLHTSLPTSLGAQASRELPFELTAQDGGRMVGPKGLTLELASDVIHPGETVELRIQAPASFEETAVVLLHATAAGSGRKGRWPFLVAPTTATTPGSATP